MDVKQKLELFFNVIKINGTLEGNTTFIFKVYFTEPKKGLQPPLSEHLC